MSQLSSRVNGPIFGLGSDRSKLVMYKNSPDPIQTRDLLVRLAKWEPDGTNARKQQWEIFKRFQKWKESHFEDSYPFETQ